MNASGGQLMNPPVALLRTWPAHGLMLGAWLTRSRLALLMLRGQAAEITLFSFPPAKLVLRKCIMIYSIDSWPPHPTSHPKARCDKVSR